MTMCGSNNLKSLNVLLSKEKVKGLVEFLDGEAVRITERGLAQEASTTTGEAAGLLTDGSAPNRPRAAGNDPRYVQDQSWGDARKIFQYLRGAIAAIPASTSSRRGSTLDEIVQASGYQGNNMNSFMVMLSKLTAPKLVVRTGDGRYRLGDMCFLDEGASGARTDE
jgi:hypothetical protein